MLHTAKRKSAVELLQESKAFYVKSEKVLDTKQELKNSGHLQVTSPAVDIFLRAPLKTWQYLDRVKISQDRRSCEQIVSPAGDNQRNAANPFATFTATVTAIPCHPSGDIIKCSVGSVNSTHHVVNTGCVVSGAKSERMVLHHYNQPNHQVVTYHPPIPIPPRASDKGFTPPLPPKSPRIAARPRSRTFNDHNQRHDFRRSHSHSEKGSDDIQMKLRRLLNTDSKENISGCIGGSEKRRSDIGHRLRSDADVDIIVDFEDATSPMQTELASCEFKTVVGEETFLRPRQHQPVNYSIHKSMPDLSPNKLGTVGGEESSSGRGRHESLGDEEASDDSDSLSGRAPKSVETPHRSYSRATSDYVSRSPSCKFCPSETGSAPAMRNSADSDDDDDDGADADDDDDDSDGPVGLMRGRCGSGGQELLRMSTSVDVEGDDDHVRRRPILRSKSDISHRYSRSSEFSLTPMRRAVRSSADLECFFEHLGMEVGAYRCLAAPSSLDSSPVFFESVSSVDSWPGASAGGGMIGPDEGEDTVAVKDGIRNTNILQHGMTEPSIVERNARIIKWLCNCRKAQIAASS